MNNIYMSLDNIPYNSKPSKDEVRTLSARIEGKEVIYPL